MNSFKPELLLSLRSYSKDQLIKDLIAGVIVAIIALPLSIALALASGVNPEQGLYTAIVAGFLIAALGGSKVQISGPTAAFATIVAGIVARNGMSGLALATVMAGIILVLMGLFKLGNLIRFIPFTITTGFTSGIAVTILIGQLKDFFGVTYAAGTVAVETMEKAKALAENFSTFNPYALLVGALCLLILIFWPRISRRIPGSLIAIVASVLLVKLCNLPVNTIGDLYSISSSLPAFTLPEFSFSAVGALLPDALTIAVLAAIESLLSCVVADGMIGSKHNSNMELVAQGIGNIGSALFGGRNCQNGSKHQERGPDAGGRHCSCGGPVAYSCSAYALRSADSDACDRGDPAYGCLQHERMEAVCPDHKDSAQKRCACVGAYIPAHGGVRSCNRHRGWAHIDLCAFHETHERHHEIAQMGGQCR